MIGEPNYLKKATRSDISYVVHQCTWFVSDLKVEHGEAVQCLGRYLKGTHNKGAIMRPVPEKELEVFVNASFCGDWDPVEAARDRDTAQSWHGYIINYAGGPLLWKTQLQTEVALLSTENEYTGLSSVLRDDIPIMQLLKEMYRPQTKHFNVCLHHFCDYVEQKKITIHPSNTSDQPADVLTKALNEELLERHCRKVLGR